jgi:hypothetical protein
MELLELEFSREIHPVDVIEQVAHNNDWAFERAGDDEISISVAGSWTDYHVSFSWMEDSRRCIWPVLSTSRCRKPVRSKSCGCCR